MGDRCVRKVNRGGTPRLIIDFLYRDKDGRQRRYRRDASVQTMAAAKAEAQRLQTLAATTGTLELRSAAPTFREFVTTTFEALCMPRYRPATRVRYKALLGQGVLDALGTRRLDEITLPVLGMYTAALLGRRIQPRGHLNFIRSVLRAAVSLGVLERMPAMPKLPRQGRKLPDSPTDEEVRALLATAGGWLRVAIALAVYAGLRMGEVRALEVRDVDLVRDQLLVRRALSENELLTPKSGHERPVPLLPELRAVLTCAMRSKLPTARVIMNAFGRTPGRQHVLAALKELERRRGLRERSFHSLRHYFCSTLVRRGASVEAVRLLAGHSNLAVTERYVHAAGAELRSAITKLSGN